MDKGIGISQSELIQAERLEIWRRRIRVKLPDKSELDLRNEAYKKVLTANSDTASITEEVYDSHFNYLLEVLSLPIRAVPDSLLPPPSDGSSKNKKNILNINSVARIIHEELQKQIKNLKTPNSGKSVWQREYDEFSNAVNKLTRLSVEEIRDDILSEPMGLALSGGGIRSASFNLGLIESLKKSGITDQIDYLSTVSGGGYIGTSWSVNSAREQTRFPFRQHDDGLDDVKINWLRSHGSYLTTGREISSISFIASIFKGVFINALVWLPPILLLFWLMTLNSEELSTIVNKIRVFNWITYAQPHYLVFWSLMMMAFLSLHILQTSKKRSIRQDYAIPLITGISMCSLPAVTFYFMITIANLKFGHEQLNILNHVKYVLLTIAGIFSMLSLFVLLDHFNFPSIRRYSTLFPVRNRFRLMEYMSWIVTGGIFLTLIDSILQLKMNPIEQVLFFIGLILGTKLAVNIIFMAFLSASSWKLHVEDQRMFAVIFGDLMILSLVFLFLGSLPLIHSVIVTATGSMEIWSSLLGGLASLVGIISTILGWAGRGKKEADEQSGMTAVLLRTGVTVLVAVFILASYSWVNQLSISDTAKFSNVTIISLILAFASWLALVVFSNINHISMHFYYRNRLADAFLSHPHYGEVINKCKEHNLEITTAAAAYLSGLDTATWEKIIRITDYRDNKIDLLDIMEMVGDPIYVRIRDCCANIQENNNGEKLARLDKVDRESPIALLASLCGYNSENVERVISWLNTVCQNPETSGRVNGSVRKMLNEFNLSSLGPEFSGVMPMANANIGRSGAPYHIINTNLVLAGSHDPKLKARHGDSFIFTPKAIGAKTVGWCQSITSSSDTVDTIKRHGMTTFSTAMAISGAAVDNNVGSTSSAPLRFLMTLLNVRLGYWKMSPKAILEGEKPEYKNWLGKIRLKINSLLPESWLFLIVREMFGLMNEKSDYVRLSDGGHFENLGLYELVRRRCSPIVVSDAGADPEYEFSDLARAILRVRSDFGVNINVDYLPLKMSKESDSNQKKRAASPVVEGRIEYPEHEGEPAFVGRLILVKTNVFEQLDSPDVLAYSLSHKAFPDETTADQFFDECQFEAYRQLGKGAGELAAKHIKGFSPFYSELDIKMERVYRRFHEFM